MKICVFGAGAIGGYMAGELALAGHDVCAIARGAHLAAIQRVLQRSPQPRPKLNLPGNRSLKDLARKPGIEN